MSKTPAGFPLVSVLKRLRAKVNALLVMQHSFCETADELSFCPAVPVRFGFCRYRPVTSSITDPFISVNEAKSRPFYRTGLKNQDRTGSPISAENNAVIVPSSSST